MIVGFFWWGLREARGKLHVMVPESHSRNDRQVTYAGCVMKRLRGETLRFTTSSVNAPS